MKKGFTLVELMAVIILLGVIALIAYPTVTSTVNSSKEKAYEETIRQIESAASRYGADNPYDLPLDESTVKQVTIAQLIKSGYIQKTENGKLYNPIDSTEMTGCVLIQYDPYYTQYMYEYSETCSGQIVYAPPTVRFEVLDATPVNGWYNEGFYVKATITDNSGNGIKESYTCVGDNECNPTTSLSELEKTFYIENQGNNRMCIKTIDNNNKETTLCSDTYKLDAVAPTVTSDGVITITKGDNRETTSYLDISYSISGTGSVSCDTSNVKTLSEGVKTVICNITGNNGLTTEISQTFNVLYIDFVLNGADPELDSGMIPIEITSDGIIKKAGLNSEWYNYTDKKWANAVLVSNESRQTYQNATAGTVISVGDIKAYYVWIPRYKYQIFTDVNNLQEVGSISDASKYTNKAQVINVEFENNKTPKSTGASKNSWLTHPAFTFGNEELNGIWVGKFETTGSSSEPTVLGYDSRYTETNSITSLRSQNVSEQFLTSQKINYGLTSLEASMLKNMEWGAIAYLTASNYGQGKTEVMINNSKLYNTGCAATVAPINTISEYLEQTVHEEGYYAGCENEWYKTLGQKASTTGNQYGIYDMSGGTWEYVMGVMEESLGSKIPTSGRNNDYNSGFTGVLTHPTSGSDTSITNIVGENFPNKKYFDLYEYATSLAVYAGRGHLGDATYELDGFSNWTVTAGKTFHSGWNQDYAGFVDTGAPWFLRGGSYTYGTGAGVFTFDNDTGDAYDYITFRSVLR